MTPTHKRTVGALAVVSGLLWSSFGAIKLAAPDVLDTTKLTSSLEHAMMAGFAVALLCTAPLMLELAKLATRREGAIAAAIGMSVLAAVVTASNLHGDDYSWFPVAAIPCNLLWLGGSIALAVALRRAGQAPRAVAFLLPVMWITALPLSKVGGDILTGAYWAAVGLMLARGTLERPAATQPAAA